MKTILELSHIEAEQFFLKQENYCNIDLPKYFNFLPLLNNLLQDGNIKNISLYEAKKIR